MKDCLKLLWAVVALLSDVAIKPLVSKVVFQDKLTQIIQNLEKDLKNVESKNQFTKTIIFIYSKNCQGYNLFGNRVRVGCGITIKFHL